mmetsp:Transcript_10653/g.23497  ORF Transcript_10653/g.23497 Transcript_10653/m.23497 type:complete len:181 (+) Transcript_10653:65-607(+)
MLRLVVGLVAGAVAFTVRGVDHHLDAEDAEFCEAVQHLCMEGNDKVAGENSTAIPQEDPGSVRAASAVHSVWAGPSLKPYVDYIRDCFQYTVGPSSNLPAGGNNARLTSSDGSTARSYNVKSGREKHGLCYAIYWIGAIEGKSKTRCKATSDKASWRATNCPDCCRKYIGGGGCKGGCQP